jgi:CSLREA domain-containing protein
MLRKKDAFFPTLEWSKSQCVKEGFGDDDDCPSVFIEEFRTRVLARHRDYRSRHWGHEGERRIKLPQNAVHQQLTVFNLDRSVKNMNEIKFAGLVRWMLLMILVPRRFGSCLARSAPDGRSARAGSAYDFVVNANDDSDDGVCSAAHCSLREAIKPPTQTAGLTRSIFNIPGAGVHRISPVATLPAITDEVTINGYSQPGVEPEHSSSFRQRCPACRTQRCGYSELLPSLDLSSRMTVPAAL